MHKWFQSRLAPCTVLELLPELLEVLQLPPPPEEDEEEDTPGRESSRLETPKSDRSWEAVVAAAAAAAAATAAEFECCDWCCGSGGGACPPPPPRCSCGLEPRPEEDAVVADEAPMPPPPWRIMAPPLEFEAPLTMPDSAEASPLEEEEEEDLRPPSAPEWRRPLLPLRLSTDGVGDEDEARPPPPMVPTTPASMVRAGLLRAGLLSSTMSSFSAWTALPPWVWVSPGDYQGNTRG